LHLAVVLRAEESVVQPGWRWKNSTVYFPGTEISANTSYFTNPASERADTMRSRIFAPPAPSPL
jgi:hypothetical protein